MAIEKLVVDNFRSIEHVEIELGSLNALIGPNNSGKSNILRALNLILGETWPGRPLPDTDFYNYVPDGRVGIWAKFAEPLPLDDAVSGFRLEYVAREGGEYYCTDANGNPCLYASGATKRVSNIMRAQRALLYLGLERLADRQVRATQWTLYGRLLEYIEQSIPQPNRGQFVSEVGAAFDDRVRPTLASAQRIIDEFVRRQTGLGVKLDLKPIDPLSILKMVRPFVQEHALSFDAGEVGAGLQSAIAIGIAKAYADLIRVPVILALEEPELYLHPHGCRHFYQLLKGLAGDGLQIVYTTHSRSFVDVGEFDSVHIVRKADGKTKVTSGKSLSLSSLKDRLRRQSKFNERINEVFFASFVVLTEGPADEIACRCALEKLYVELDRQSVSVVSLGGKNEIPIVAEVLAGLGIPTVGLMDEDPSDPSTLQVRMRIEQILGCSGLFLQSPNLEGLYGLSGKPGRAEAIAFFPIWFAQASNAVPQVYLDLKRAIPSG